MGEEIRGALSATPHPSIAIAGTGIFNHHHPTDFLLFFFAFCPLQELQEKYRKAQQDLDELEKSMADL